MDNAPVVDIPLSMRVVVLDNLNAKRAAGDFQIFEDIYNMYWATQSRNFQHVDSWKLSDNAPSQAADWLICTWNELSTRYKLGLITANAQDTLTAISQEYDLRFEYPMQGYADFAAALLKLVNDLRSVTIARSRRCYTFIKRDGKWFRDDGTMFYEPEFRKMYEVL